MKKFRLVSVALATACCWYIPAIFASTPDGQTPAQETVCSSLSGKSFGICNAYCEAMDCDYPGHKASNNACQKKLDQWSELHPGVTIPCAARKASLNVTKEASPQDYTNGGIVTYTVTVINTGEVPLIISCPVQDISNIPIPNTNHPIDCATFSPSLYIALPVGESAVATYNVSFADALAAVGDGGTVQNTVKVNGTGINGVVAPPASATVTANVTDSPPRVCPCAQSWDDGNGAASLSSQPNSSFNIACAETGGLPGAASLERSLTENPFTNYEFHYNPARLGTEYLCHDANPGLSDNLFIPAPPTAAEIAADFDACKALLNAKGCNIP